MRKEKTDHKVKIIIAKIETDTTDDFKRSFVVPGHQHVERNDTITWETEDNNAVFLFPNEELFGKRVHRVKKDGSLSLTVSSEAESGHYPYAVATKNNEFAIGGSYPKVIVE